MLEVREKRVAAKKTLKEIATSVGVSECYISQIETGARRPSVETAKKIAAVLGFDWTRFYEEGGEQHGSKGLGDCTELELLGELRRRIEGA